MARALDPGRMQEEVAVQAQVRTTTPGGGYTEAWTDVPAWSSIWVEIEPLRGSEQLRGMQLSASATHRVRGWLLQGVKSTTHRLRRTRDNGIMDIIAPPLIDYAHATMELLVHETEVPA